MEKWSKSKVTCGSKPCDIFFANYRYINKLINMKTSFFIAYLLTSDKISFSFSSIEKRYKSTTHNSHIKEHITYFCKNIIFYEIFYLIMILYFMIGSRYFKLLIPSNWSNILLEKWSTQYWYNICSDESFQHFLTCILHTKANIFYHLKLQKRHIPSNRNANSTGASLWVYRRQNYTEWFSGMYFKVIYVLHPCPIKHKTLFSQNWVECIF